MDWQWLVGAERLIPHDQIVIVVRHDAYAKLSQRSHWPPMAIRNKHGRMTILRTLDSRVAAYVR